MIKGVNKQIVEINYTQNDYIEKAILIINPEKSKLSKELINQKVDDYMKALLPAEKPSGISAQAAKEKHRYFSFAAAVTGLLLLASALLFIFALLL